MSQLKDSPGPYGRLALWAVRNRLWVALGVMVLTAIAAVVGLPPQVDNDILGMMPQNDPIVQASNRIDEAGGIEMVTLGFTDDAVEEGQSERLEAYVADLAQRFDALDSVEFVFYEIDPDLAYRIGLLQLDPADVRELSQRLRGALALGPALNPVMTQRLLEVGPLTDRLAEAQDASLLGNDGQTARLIVHPTHPSQDRQFAMMFYDQVQEILAEDPPEDHGLRMVWFGGAHRHVVDDIRTLARDFAWTSGLAALAVLGILALAFRDLRALVIVFVPILVANTLTLGLVGLWVGYLNTFTAAAVPVLIGLGIDFAVHLFGRYREGRARGKDLETALAEAWDRVGPPCMTAGLTSAAGFLALAAATFRGFSQFGIVLAFGLLACLAVMLIGLPVLISLLDPKPGRALPGLQVDATESSSTYRLAPVGLMVVVIATGVAGAIALPRLGFDYDISSMRAEGLAYDELNEVERDLAEKSFTPMVVSFGSAEARVAGQERLDKRIADGELPFGGSTVSVENLIPSDMDVRLDDLRQLAQLVRSPNLRYLHASPARPMVEALMPLRDMDLRPLTEDDLPAGLLRIMGGDSDAYRVLVLPAGNVWDMRNALALTRGIQDAEPDAEVAGAVAIQGLLFEYVSADMPLVGSLALILVVLLAAIDLRNPLFIIGAVGTLLAGIVWAGVMLQIADVHLSVINVVGVPILLGIGVDVVIHLLHRLREEGPGGVRRAWRTTGVAALVSTSTTVASFAALMLASSRGIRSLGLLVVVGLTTITVVGALLLPLAWAAGWRVTGQAPGDQDD